MRRDERRKNAANRFLKQCILLGNASRVNTHKTGGTRSKVKRTTSPRPGRPSKASHPGNKTPISIQRPLLAARVLGLSQTLVVNEPDHRLRHLLFTEQALKFCERLVSLLAQRPTGKPWCHFNQNEIVALMNVGFANGASVEHVSARESDHSASAERLAQVQPCARRNSARASTCNRLSRRVDKVVAEPLIRQAGERRSSNFRVGCCAKHV